MSRRKGKLVGLMTFRVHCPHRHWDIPIGLSPAGPDGRQAPFLFISGRRLDRVTQRRRDGTAKLRWQCAECRLDVSLSGARQEKFLTPLLLSGRTEIDLGELSRIVGRSNS